MTEYTLIEYLKFAIFVQYILDVDAIVAMIELLLCEGVRHRRKPDRWRWYVV